MSSGYIYIYIYIYEISINIIKGHTYVSYMAIYNEKVTPIGDIDHSHSGYEKIREH